MSQRKEYHPRSVLRTLSCFWTGSNEISDDRRQYFETLNKSELTVVLVMSNNLSLFILPVLLFLTAIWIRFCMTITKWLLVMITIYSDHEVHSLQSGIPRWWKIDDIIDMLNMLRLYPNRHSQHVFSNGYTYPFQWADLLEHIFIHYIHSLESIYCKVRICLRGLNPDNSLI